MRRIAYFLFFLLMVTHSDLRGQKTKSNPMEEETIAKMIDAVGGIEVWSKAKGFRMLEIAWYGNLDHPLVREFWVDFEQPRIRMETKSIERRQAVALNISSGWTKAENQKTTQWDADRVNGWKSFWPGIPTRVFSLIAQNHPSLTYELFPDRIDFFVDGTFAVWISVSKDGVPLAYGRNKEHTETHFLGEVMPYGPVKLWKEATEPGGQWKVEMVDYELLTTLPEGIFHWETLEK